MHKFVSMGVGIVAGMLVVGGLWGNRPDRVDRLPAVERVCEPPILEAVIEAGWVVEISGREEMIIDPADGMGYWVKVWEVRAARGDRVVEVRGGSFEEAVGRLLAGVLD